MTALQALDPTCADLDHAWTLIGLCEASSAKRVRSPGWTWAMLTRPEWRCDCDDCVRVEVVVRVIVGGGEQ